jgi:hypothetical protein
MIRVRVSEEHIAKGEKDNCSKCPLGLALWEAFSPDVNDVEVGIENITVWSGTDCLPSAEYSCCGKTGDFVESFDAGEEVKPGWLLLDPDLGIASFEEDSDDSPEDGKKIVD